MFKRLAALIGGHSLAMDLGTANILLYTPDFGVVINEPSVIALDTYTENVICVGSEAKAFIGRTPDRISVIRPIRNGVIAHFEATRQMITHFVSMATKDFKLVKPKLIICVPMGVTPVEKRAVIEAGLQGGAREVSLIAEPMAGAIGAGLPIKDPLGNMVLDIGGGTSEVAVISMSEIAYSESIRIAGDAMNIAIQRYFQDKYQLLIGETVADKAKIEIGAAVALPEERSTQVYGKNLVDGAPTSVTATDNDIREAIKEPLAAIVRAVRNALEKTTPELIADVHDNGLLLVGGGALLTGLDMLLEKEIQVKVTLDVEPLTTIVRGTGMVLDKKNALEHVLLDD